MLGKRGFVIVGVVLVLALLAGVSYFLWPRSGSTTGQAVQLAQPPNLRSETKESLPGDSNPRIITSPSRSAVAQSLARPPAVAIFRGSSAKKVVALTFDDGPSPYTPQIAALLTKDRAPATFSCIGKEAAEDRAEIARLKAAGFEVENHTWDHPQLTHLSLEAILAEITRTNQIVGPAKYLRPPYGSFNPTVSEAAASLHMKLVLWNVDTLDWKYRNVGSILRYLKAEVRPGSIVLMHDGGGNRSQTVAALPQVIGWLWSQGYSLVNIDQLVKALPAKSTVSPNGESGRVHKGDEGLE